MKIYKNILIIKMSSLGDIVHALPTLAALRENQPTARIVWAVHEAFQPLLPGKPYLDEVIVVDRKRLKQPVYLQKLRRELKAFHFDLTIDLQCIAKSALISLLSGAPERVGYWELREGSSLVNRRLVGPNQYGHVIERYRDVVRELGGKVEKELTFPLPELDQEKAWWETEKKDFLPAGQSYCAIAPAARGIQKEWPPEYFSELINWLDTQGLPTVLLGTKADMPKGELIISGVHAGSKVLNLMGRTTLREMLAVIAGCRLFVAADTGPLHLAFACRRPLVGLYGVTPPSRTAPYGRDNIRILASPASTIRADERIKNDPDSMKALTVPMVQAACRALLNNKQ